MSVFFLLGIRHVLNDPRLNAVKVFSGQVIVGFEKSNQLLYHTLSPVLHFFCQKVLRCKRLAD